MRPEQCRTASARALSRSLRSWARHSTNRAPGAGRRGVAVAGGQVIDDGHVMPGLKQGQGADAADVSGAAGDEDLHAAVRSIAAASSGRTSLIQAPMAASDPARYFSRSALR